MNACWSSKDGEDCDYGDFVTRGLAPGSLDPLPPVQFVISLNNV